MRRQPVGLVEIIGSTSVSGGEIADGSRLEKASVVTVAFFVNSKASTLDMMVAWC